MSSIETHTQRDYGSIVIPKGEGDRKTMGRVLGTFPDTTSATYDEVSGLILHIKDEQTFMSILDQFPELQSR